MHSSLEEGRLVIIAYFPSGCGFRKIIAISGDTSTLIYKGYVIVTLYAFLLIKARMVLLPYLAAVPCKVETIFYVARALISYLQTLYV